MGSNDLCCVLIDSGSTAQHIVLRTICRFTVPTFRCVINKIDPSHPGGLRLPQYSRLTCDVTSPASGSKTMARLTRYTLPVRIN